MPMSATFILFDLVACYPRHSETNKNLALLDQAAEYFTRLEMASQGVIPGRKVAEFATIARHYIRKIKFDGAGPGGVHECDFSTPDLMQGSEKLGEWNLDMELENLCVWDPYNPSIFNL